MYMMAVCVCDENEGVAVSDGVADDKDGDGEEEDN